VSTLFRYYHREVVFVQRSTLFRTLAEAVLSYDREWIAPIPTAHRTRGPLSPSAGGLNWWVVRNQQFDKPGTRIPEEPSSNLIANFACPLDAFAFAEMQAAHSKKNKERWKWYHVELRWRLEDGRVETLEKLPVTWLRDVRRQRDREEKRRHEQEKAAA
jgi:hypothetical protein